MIDRKILCPSNPTENKFQQKDIILTRKINNVIYEIMVKTNSNMVYVGEKDTLTEVLSKIADLLTENKENIDEVKKRYDEIISPSDDNPNEGNKPSETTGFKSFKEVWDYLNVNGEPKSELIRLIESKQASEEGKGLSENDFTDILYKKLLNDYTKEELDAKFDIIARTEEDLARKITIFSSSAVVPMSLTEKAPEEVRDGGIWFQIIEKNIEPEEN